MTLTASVVVGSNIGNGSAIDVIAAGAMTGFTGNSRQACQWDIGSRRRFIGATRFNENLKGTPVTEGIMAFQTVSGSGINMTRVKNMIAGQIIGDDLGMPGAMATDTVGGPDRRVIDNSGAGS